MSLIRKKEKEQRGMQYLIECHGAVEMEFPERLKLMLYRFK